MQISGQHQATLYFALGRRSSFHGTKHRFNGGIARSLDAHLIYLAFVQANIQDACLKRLRRDGTAGEEVSMLARNRLTGLCPDLKIGLSKPATDERLGRLHPLRTGELSCPFLP